jgi:hypothetical protein
MPDFWVLCFRHGREARILPDRWDATAANPGRSRRRSLGPGPSETPRLGGILPKDQASA